MEVEAQTLPTFNKLQSNPSFPIILDDLGREAQECSISELSLASNHNLKSVETDVEVYTSSESSPASDHGVKSTATDAEKYASFELSATLNLDVKSTATNAQYCSMTSESFLALSPSVQSMDSNGQESTIFESTAALKLQKVYRSYRTRRRLADSAVVAEELWWQAIDFVRLNHSTISFFNFSKPETAASRWNRISLNASKVGKGLSKDAKALKLAFQHWIEAIDPRHRYGHGLHVYYEEWCRTESGQPFFFWLDVGDGKDVDLKEYPRSKLRQQSIKYLGPQEREHYEYIVCEGKIELKQTGQLLDTSKGLQGSKWIFVMSTSKKFYAGEKKKGIFHHSSFLAGGATLAAGRLSVVDGVLKSISAYSGHYRPTEENLDNFLTFLEENGVNLDEVQIRYSEDYENYEDKSIQGESTVEAPIARELPQLEIPNELQKEQPPVPTEAAQTESSSSYQRTLSGGLQSPRAEVPKKVILQRINSKKAASSYQLGHQLSLKWSTGAGPRIGCVADYPMELRAQALEFVNLSPRLPLTPSSFRQLGGYVSPRPRPTFDISNRDVTSDT